MFRHLGRFGVLAVCLFVLAMGGCDIPLNSVNVPSTQPSVLGGYNLPPDDMKVKLAGVYRLVEVSDAGVTQRAPAVDGVLVLPLNGKASISQFGPGFREPASSKSMTWNADKTHLIFPGGKRFYSWDGRFLTFFEPNGVVSKWVKTD